jgi:hypothetical protein
MPVTTEPPDESLLLPWAECTFRAELEELVKLIPAGGTRRRTS